MKYKLSSFLILFWLSSCSMTEQLEPTITPSPEPSQTASPLPSATMRPSPIPTSTLGVPTQYLMIVPLPPAGFDWKVLPEKQLAILIPHGWFFKEEFRADLDAHAIYVTPESIDSYSDISVGLSLFIFEGFSDKVVAQQFAKEIIEKQSELPPRTDVLSEWDYQTDSYTEYRMRIAAVDPSKPEPNDFKIIQYTSFPAQASVYLEVFEIPLDLWDQTITEFGDLLDPIVLLGG